ncbi:MAG: arsinothricin resistance N-acetyltransferase ArsN1 family B [Myxococcota bacterium]
MYSTQRSPSPRPYGVTALGVERVIQQAGVSKGTFFSHFGAKEDLFEEPPRNRRRCMTELREATAHDAAGIRAIYAPVVEHTAISFEADVPSVGEIAARIGRVQSTTPWLVLDDQGVVEAYAYASPHRAREAYQWSVEVSAYVATTARRRGHARRLYTVLFELLALQGFAMAFAGITLPNEASVGLHASLGFERVGVYPNVGFKHGAWHDVGWWSRPLGPLPESPQPPRPLADLRRDPRFGALLTG